MYNFKKTQQIFNMIKTATLVNADLETVWNCFTNPEHVVKWNFASDDWHAPKATSEFVVGGKFIYTMAAKDGSMVFDFSGIFDEIVQYADIGYTLDDGRKVEVTFYQTPDGILVHQEFEPESENPEELQENGWQAILDNFKKYVESTV